MIYLGITHRGERIACYSPPAELHWFRSVIGPFRTSSGARFMRDNPDCATVEEAEQHCKEAKAP